MAWTTTELGMGIQEVDIETNIWADHNPISLCWKGEEKRPRWQMNKEILKEDAFLKLLNQEMKFFFEENRNEDTSAQNNWDTAKAIIRGVAIKYTARKNKEKILKRTTLQNKIRILEGKLQEDPGDKKLREEKEILKHKLNLIEQEEIAQKIRLVKQNFFEHGNKPGRWLSHRLRREKDKRRIDHLKDDNGNIYHQKEEKNRIILQYYMALYTQDHIEKATVKEYLEKAELPTVPEDIRDRLNDKITIREIQTATKKQKNNKTPGTDGLPAELYKNTHELLGEHLLLLFNDALQNWKIPKSWLEAYITLIPKENTDTKLIRNYRPISLLNVDYKIFVSILAERMKTYLKDFIHWDQNGFLPKRHLRNNLRTIINVLEYYEAHPEKYLALMFVDAQKAFDNVNWDFIFIQLEQMKFGEKFIGAIKTIYMEQKAKIIVNGETTEYFKIEKGTRQGCPLSPLLYILTLEVLLRKVRQEEGIKGTKIKREEYKTQAFADDMLFIMENPLETGPKLLQIIEEFGKLAGLKMNKEKTVILTKNIPTKHKALLRDEMGIQTEKRVKYLGIWLTSKCSSLREDNYNKLLAQIKLDLERWSNIRLSLMGRIAVIKTNILPRVLYLFQTIPIHLNKTYFKELERITQKFIWQGKRARIKIKMLQEAKERGGLGAPNWELYYRATVMVWVKEWIMLRDKRTLALEGHDLQAGWHAYLWGRKHTLQGCFQNHLLRKALLEVWEKVKGRYYIKTPCWISPIEALTYPNALGPGRLLIYKDILNEDGRLKSIEELRKQNLNLDWWSYAQTQAKYKKDGGPEGIARGWQEFDKILLENDDKLITKVYSFLLNLEMEEEIVKDSMIAWARNIGHTIELKNWQTIWERNLKLTMSTAYKENTYKMIYRWHLPPARLAKMFPSLTPNCWKCKATNGTYYHMWWQCSKTQNYWKKIKNWLQEITGKKIEMNPEFFLLGMIPDKFGKHNTHLALHILTAARLIFAQDWKKDKIPTEDRLISKILECAESDNLTKMLRNKGKEDYNENWKNWYIWLSKRKSS